MHVDPYLYLIPLLPLLGFAVNGLLGDKLTRVQIGLVACAGPIAAFALSIWALWQVHHGHDAHQVLWTWIATGSLSVDFGLTVDALTAVMLMNVTGIGSLIHVYSYGYMHEDPSFSRFMAYLNLFLCAMLLLVMGDNLLLLFVGWEGVGLCSYLLIGFWYSELANVDAGRKAFVVNRVGDLAFLIGAFTLFAMTGTLSFAGMEDAIPTIKPDGVMAAGPLVGWTGHQALALAGFMLFAGATGKSAQVPLFVWLPDAMAGPTPVSALIHAATMVTAGIYLIGRMDFLYVLLPEIGLVVGLVAALTALLAGLIAVGQHDIKKVLAYSTVSQLGFMFAGMATGFWFTGLFHVVTHAFFKALLFLGAGAVIHAMHHEQDIRKMGGLWRDLRGVSVVFLVGAGALAGLPWIFAGFWSKDEVLAAVLAVAAHEGGAWYGVFALLWITAVLTAFYTTRLVLLTFFGPPADDHRHLHPVHWTMMLPLVVLAVLSTGLAAYIGEFYHHLTEHGFAVPAWVADARAHGHDPMHDTHGQALIGSLVAVVIGLGAGFALYRERGNALAASLEAAVAHKFWVDELYEGAVVKPIGGLAQLAYDLVDRLLVDGGMVHGPARLVMGASIAARATQSGFVAVTAATTLVGGVVVVVWMVLNG